MRTTTFIKLIVWSFLVLAFTLAPYTITYSEVVTPVLRWDANPDADYYVVYFGATSHNYTQNSTKIPTETTEYTLPILSEGTWYFSVKAFNEFGNSSDFSDELKYETCEIVEPVINGLHITPGKVN